MLKEHLARRENHMLKEKVFLPSVTVKSLSEAMHALQRYFFVDKVMFHFYRFQNEYKVEF